MSLKLLKSLQVGVGVCVVGVLVCLAGTIAAAVKQHHVEKAINPATIPVPATLSQ